MIKRYQIKEVNVWKIIAILWLIILTSPFVFRQAGAYIPASYWYDLKLVEVTNYITKEGERVLNVDRDIYANFDGKWRTSEQLLTDEGFVAVRLCYGEAFYQKDKSLPDPPTLQWWTNYAKDCDVLLPREFVDSRFTPGTYRVCTTVSFETNFGRKSEALCSSTYDIPNPDPELIDESL